MSVAHQQPLQKNHGPSSGETKLRVRRPPMLTRVAALFIDSLCLGGLALLIFVPMGFLLGAEQVGTLLKVPYLMNLVGVLLCGFYYVGNTVFFGTTPGKRVFGLRVISTQGHGMPTLTSTILRETVGRSLSGLLFLSLIHI